MAVQRTNPLPVGTYWIDIFQPTDSSPKTKDGWPPWIAWVEANQGKVKTISEQEFEEDLFLGGPIRVFVIFRVSAATTTPFPFRELGFPTIAEASVQKSDDTVQKPPPASEPPGFFSGLSIGAGSGALLALAAIWYFSSDRK